MKPEIITITNEAWIKIWDVLDSDDLNGLKTLLVDFPYLEHWYPQGGKIMHFAIYNQNIGKSSPKIAKYLIDREHNIDTPGFGGRTPLILACQSGSIDLVKYLIEKGAAVNVCDENRDTSLIFAARIRNHEIVKLLLEYNVNPHVINKSKESAITFTSKSFFYPKEDKLLKSMIEIGMQSFNYEEPISFAGYEKITELNVPEALVKFEDFIRTLVHKIESPERIKVFGITASVFNGFISVMLSTNQFEDNFKKVNQPYFKTIEFEDWKNGYKSYTRWKTITHMQKELKSKYQAPGAYIAKPLYEGLKFSLKKLKKENIFKKFSKTTKIGITMYEDETYYIWKNWPTSIIQ